MNNSKCQRCDSTKITTISAKCSDRFWYRNEWNDVEQDGYVTIKEISQDDNEDYVDFTFCRKCGQIQGKWEVKKICL